MNSPTPPPPIAPQTSGLAVASLILGILSIAMCLGPLAGIPAVILGHKANSAIRRSGGLLQGSGMATGGLVTGYFSIFMIALWGLLAAIAIPNFVKAKQRAQFNACRQNQVAIQGAKEIWAKENASPEDAVPTDSDLFGPGKPISEKPQCPANGRYSPNSVKEAPSCTFHGSISRDRWEWSGDAAR